MIRWKRRLRAAPVNALRAGVTVAVLTAATAGCGAGAAATAGVVASPSAPSVVVSDAFPGASVDSVRAGSAAARAGLKTGDLVTAVDGKPLNTAQELPQVLAKLPAGKSARLSVTRADGSTAAISITLRVLSG